MSGAPWPSYVVTWQDNSCRFSVRLPCLGLRYNALSSSILTLINFILLFQISFAFLGAQAAESIGTSVEIVTVPANAGSGSTLLLTSVHRKYKFVMAFLLDIHGFILQNSSLYQNHQNQPLHQNRTTRGRRVREGFSFSKRHANHESRQPLPEAWMDR